MPPIPPRSPSFSEKTIIITESIDQSTAAVILALKRLQNDILNFQIPRLRSVVTDSSSKVNIATQERYAAELRLDLEKFTIQVEDLELRVDDEPRRKDREEVRRFADEFKAICLALRLEMRSAVLDSKRAIEARGKLNRDLIIGPVLNEKSLLNEKPLVSEKPSAIEENENEKGGSGDDVVMVEKDNVTEALRRTIGLMQNELERSVLSVQLLEESTETLQRTSMTHDTLNSLTQTSKTLIKALDRADTMDRLLIIAALIFFFLVVAFILRERMLMRGVRGVKGVGRFVGWGLKGALRAGTRGASTLSTIPLASETSTSSTAIQSLHSAATSVIVTVAVAEEDTSVSPTLASIVVTTALSSTSTSIHVEL